MGNPVGWFEIYVQDMARAKAFYEGVFQRQLEALPSPDIEMWSFGMNDQGYGASGALVKVDCAPSGAGGTLVYFSCEDCALEAGRAADLGGVIARPKMSIGDYGHIAVVRDPDGNMIGLHSMK